MRYHVLRRGVRVDRLGSLPVGWRGELPTSIAALYLPSGAIELEEALLRRLNPSQASGEKPSASPVVPASQKQTLRKSGRGGKRKKGDTSS